MDSALVIPLLTLALCTDSPVSPESWLLSLMFVVVVTMVKQGYEDYLRSAAATRVQCVKNLNTTRIRSEY